MSIYKIRDCYLNLIERRVVRDGQFLDLTPKTFDVLKLLFERRGEVVSKDEILGVVWNGSFVEESNLPVHVSKVRRTLDAMNYQSYIETVQGSGYRFVAPVTEVKQADWDMQISAVKPFESKPSLWKFDSIAILPLYNEAQTEEYQYLADGLTESFINSLSRQKGLRVMARNTAFRYKDKVVDPKEVGETLGVSTVLTGRLRVVKDKIIIAIELTKTEDGSNLWGNHFDSDFRDIVDIRDRIQGEFLTVLFGGTVESNHLASADLTMNSESYRYYLKGLYQAERWTHDSLFKAIEYFKKSSTLDPGNLDAYCQIVECYYSLYFSNEISREDLLKSISPYQRVLESSDTPNDLIIHLKATHYVYIDWDFEKGLRSFKEALQINPKNLQARQRYVGLLTSLGRQVEAMKELKIIAELDPLSFSTCKNMGRLFFLMGMFDSALHYLNDALEIAPEDYIVHAIIGSTFAEQGRLTEALDSFRKSLKCHYNAEVTSALGYVYALIGSKEEALVALKEIESLPSEVVHPNLKLARIHMALGDIDKAFSLISESIREKDPDVVAMNSDPRWGRIKSDSRFSRNLVEIGLLNKVDDQSGLV